jgi:FkbM family methyltransferase
VIGKAISRLLLAYYRGTDHPMKLRLWRYVRQMFGYSPLTVAYGNASWISIDERDWLQASILNFGSYEPEVWSALARFASSDEVIWDVGAHIGSFALTAAEDRRVKSVCAFEPDPLTLQTLRRNLALNGNPANIYPFALSDATELKTLIRGPRTNTGMSTLGPTASTGMRDHVSDPGRAKLPTFEVLCLTADALIADGAAPAPTLMKIDVEGWEYKVLNGAVQLMDSDCLKAIVFEAACDSTGKLKDARLSYLLTRFGYAVAHIRRPGGERRAVENYVAVRA